MFFGAKDLDKAKASQHSCLTKSRERDVKARAADESQNRDPEAGPGSERKVLVLLHVRHAALQKIPTRFAESDWTILETDTFQEEKQRPAKFQTPQNGLKSDKYRGHRVTCSQAEEEEEEEEARRGRVEEKWGKVEEK